MLNKYCKKCDAFKPHSEFSPSKKAKNGLQSYCKPCCSAYALKWYEKNKHRVAARTQQRRPRRRSILLQSKYGINLYQWTAIFNAQGKSCAICGIKELPEKIQWATDHDHKTGEIRGILCPPCNTGLGFFEDSITNLNRAIEYLDSGKLRTQHVIDNLEPPSDPEIIELLKDGRTRRNQVKCDDTLLDMVQELNL